MPRARKHSQSVSQQDLMRPSHEQERFERALRKMFLRLNREMSAEQVSQLYEDCSGKSIDAIEWALDSWGRNAKQLPKLSDLNELFEAWNRDTSFDDPKEQDSRKGTGYGQADVLWLVKRVRQLGRYDDSLLDELDKARGGAPLCRQPGFSNAR